MVPRQRGIDMRADREEIPLRILAGAGAAQLAAVHHYLTTPEQPSKLCRMGGFHAATLISAVGIGCGVFGR